MYAYIKGDLEEKSNVIYSFCFDSNDGKNKLFHVCFALKFHEKLSKFFHEKDTLTTKLDESNKLVEKYKETAEKSLEKLNEIEHV